MPQQICIKVIYDNDDEDSESIVELSEDMITLSAAGETFVPVTIVDDHIAYYLVEEANADLFWDALEKADWCYTEARQLHDDETIPA